MLVMRIKDLLLVGKSALKEDLSPGCAAFFLIKSHQRRIGKALDGDDAFFAVHLLKCIECVPIGGFGFLYVSVVPIILPAAQDEHILSRPRRITLLHRMDDKP
jgi:hypothetical protein